MHFGPLKVSFVEHPKKTEKQKKLHAEVAVAQEVGGSLSKCPTEDTEPQIARCLSICLRERRSMKIKDKKNPDRQVGTFSVVFKSLKQVKSRYYRGVLPSEAV